jgi:hypothetical protein
VWKFAGDHPVAFFFVVASVGFAVSGIAYAAAYAIRGPESSRPAVPSTAAMTAPR